MTLKSYMDVGWLTIRDNDTLKELSQYEEVTPNVYKGPRSGHDDLVCGLLWGMYFVTTPYFEAKDLSVKNIDKQFILKRKLESDSAPVVIFNSELRTVDGYGLDWGGMDK